MARVIPEPLKFYRAWLPGFTAAARAAMIAHQQPTGDNVQRAIPYEPLGDFPAVPPDYHATMNHPNRNPNSAGAHPRAYQIREARDAAGLTIAQAAALIHERPSRWQRMEAGDLHMHPASWELFQIKTERRP